MENERLAVRQRLMDVYRNELLNMQEKVDGLWEGKLRLLQEADALPPAEAFKELVLKAGFDSAVIYDANGALAYPIAAVASPEASPDRPAKLEQAWDDARQMERAGDPNATGAYARIAAAEEHIDFKGRALQAQARCLLRTADARSMGVPPMRSTGVSPVGTEGSGLQHGRDPDVHRDATHGQARQGPFGDARATAVAILAGELATDAYRAARDEAGRLIAPDALLAALHVTDPNDADARRAVAQDLLARVNDYSGPAMTSAQRRFLMTELHDEAGLSAPTHHAESVAGPFIEAGPGDPTPPGMLTRIDEAGLFALPSPDGSVVGLMDPRSVVRLLTPLIAVDAPATIDLITKLQGAPPPDDNREPLLALPASQYMQDTTIYVFLKGSDPFAASAERRNAAYLWTAVLGISFIAVMAIVLATYLGRQMRLTRLKNDLIATVSHELKTPLASMRVLVDTLREGRCRDEGQAAEYFDLIARENQRLSRLIDNFLTFSRMERNKRAFDFTAVDIGEVVCAAAEAVGERFSAPGAKLTVDVAPNLSPVRADRDALETVILNLLDNAWKYSGEDKVVALRATADGDSAVKIDVSDNGIGISRRAQRKIFSKFYQVDQTLSRRGSGCGLGLAIVKFILDAHGGSIAVKSQPGKGSTFTVRLPAGKGINHRGTEMQRRETAEGDYAD